MVCFTFTNCTRYTSFSFCLGKCRTICHEYSTMHIQVTDTQEYKELVSGHSQMLWYDSLHILQRLDDDGHSGTLGVSDPKKELRSGLPISGSGTLDLDFFDKNCILSGTCDDVYKD